MRPSNRLIEGTEIDPVFLNSPTISLAQYVSKDDDL